LKFFFRQKFPQNVSCIRHSDDDFSFYLEAAILKATNGAPLLLLNGLGKCFKYVHIPYDEEFIRRTYFFAKEVYKK
jgi:hypothetical protein